jgi:glucose-1-phosphate thymidylyltransferase
VTAAAPIGGDTGNQVVGLVPAAGRATRLGPLPCSKEIYPIGLESSGSADGQQPVSCGELLLAAMRTAGARNAFVVLRSGKWDIPSYLGDGHRLGMNLAYVMMRLPHGTPFSLAQAMPFLDGARVVMGFPDILFEPRDAFVPLLARLDTTDADVVLGLFPTDRPEQMDMVQVDPAGRVRSIVIKPASTDLEFTWIIAAWRPAFTDFFRSHLDRADSCHPPTRRVGRPEMFVGDVLRAALDAGMTIESVPFPTGSCMDVGTFGGMLRATEQFSLSQEPST